MAECDVTMTPEEEAHWRYTLLSERLSASYEAHDITRGLLAAANREIARIKSERDTLRAQVSAGAR